MGTLYIVATPIGNLKDITLRALEVLKGADFVLCEDTRVTKKLLNFYGIATPTISYHQHSTLQTKEYILKLLQESKNFALVSDAGTPGISDPGNELIAFLVERTHQSDRTDWSDLKIVPIPGPSAVVAIASVAGIPTDKFLFLGYPPHKKGRKKFFDQVAQSKYPVIFYESPYRILKSLRELRVSGFTFHIVVGRELTKKFETVYRGAIDEVAERVEKDKVKGEFVVITYKT